MSYSIKIENKTKVISGKYIPKKFSCGCEERSYRIEVLKETSDKDIAELVKVIESI